MWQKFGAGVENGGGGDRVESGAPAAGPKPSRRATRRNDQTAETESTTREGRKEG